MTQRDDSKQYEIPHLVLQSNRYRMRSHVYTKQQLQIWVCGLLLVLAELCTGETLSVTVTWYSCLLYCCGCLGRALMWLWASYDRKRTTSCSLMFIGPCIIAVVEEWKTNLMSLAILFHLLCAQHVSDINISIFRSLRCHLLFSFTSHVLNMFRALIYPSSGACDCVDKLPHRSSCSQFVVCWSFAAADIWWCSFRRLKQCFNLQNEHHQKPAAPKAPTHNKLRTRRPMW